MAAPAWNGGRPDAAVNPRSGTMPLETWKACRLTIFPGRCEVVVREVVPASSSHLFLFSFSLSLFCFFSFPCYRRPPCPQYVILIAHFPSAARDVMRRSGKARHGVWHDTLPKVHYSFVISLPPPPPAPENCSSGKRKFY
ncbi:hypothetical protein E2C01_062138 [Portunus trituberculatus]|uniref:Uncharacterized protein n=1 Tax=Portunus trituberculatus TaxID=210409 RepID=A0A5B7H5N8_PORTR|nr:hypothetical protein [Portunus trituberculatus]